MDSFTFPQGPHPSPESRHRVFVFSGRYLLPDRDLEPLTVESLEEEHRRQPLYFCGLSAGEPVFALEDAQGPGSSAEDPTFAPKDSPQPGWLDLRTFYAQAQPRWVRAAGRASQIRLFHRNHRFCGLCGTATQALIQETARKCPSCGHLFYPRLSPAVITLVHRGNEILLGHNAKAPAGAFSLFAGFIEAGESCEEAAVREVREESGVEVKNLKFHSSQSWPFPDALMMGFTAEYAGGTPCPDGEEITEVKWFSPENPPPAFRSGSIAKTLLDHFWGQNAPHKERS